MRVVGVHVPLGVWVDAGEQASVGARDVVVDHLIQDLLRMCESLQLMLDDLQFEAGTRLI